MVGVSEGRLLAMAKAGENGFPRPENGLWRVDEVLRWVENNVVFNIENNVENNVVKAALRPNPHDECSFCRKSQANDNVRLIYGPALLDQNERRIGQVRICVKCVDLSALILITDGVSLPETRSAMLQMFGRGCSDDNASLPE